MTVRDAINAMFRYLRAEQRVIPFSEVTATYDNPLPDAVDAMNTALQQLAVYLPLFGAKQQRSAYFHAPATAVVAGLTEGGMQATSAGWPAWAAGCLVQLPGDAGANRILSISGNTATLQFPHLSTTAGGDATVFCDAVTLPQDVIAVLGPVRPRGARHALEAASGREELTSCGGSDAPRYFVESAVVNREVKLRLMLSGPVSTATVIEFQARTALGTITPADVYDAEEVLAEGQQASDPGVPLPVPANFVESLFLPIATDIFFSKPCVTNYDVSSLRNEDAPKLVRQQAQMARDMMERMRPQGRKSARVRAGW